MKQTVPYFDLPAQIRSVRSELDVAIARTLDKGSFCLGPDVAEFEKCFAVFCEAKHCVAFNSGTSALHIALMLLGVGAGDEVITTPMTFVATCWAISYVGAKPVFVDVDETTCNLDSRQLEEAITPRTKAVMPVHLYGQPFDIAAIERVCTKYQIPLIEDAAQAHGALYKGRKIGSFGKISCFSFYPGKNLGACGEGGALVTNEGGFATRARSLREHGSTARYYHDEIGFNYRMEGIQGAVLGVKLKHLESWTAARRRIAAKYDEAFKGSSLKLQSTVPDGIGAHHLYVVRHENRDALQRHLEERGIGSALHYPRPVHMQKCYSGLGYSEGDFPIAEAIARECLSLPIYPELTSNQQEYVISHVLGFLNENHRKPSSNFNQPIV